MTSTVLIVTVGGFVLGYLLVARFLNRKSTSSTSSQSGGDSWDSAQTEKSKDDPRRHDSTLESGSVASAWFHILGVSESASKEQIAAAYKRLIGQYHPDKVEQLGAEIREVAEVKSKQINAAYDYVMKLRE